MPNTLLARYLKLMDVMLEFGPNIGLPHTKALGSGLYELRLKGKEGILRVFYCTVMHYQITMLHSFVKKTQKIPTKELKTARLRLQEVQSYG